MQVSHHFQQPIGKTHFLSDINKPASSVDSLATSRDTFSKDPALVAPLKFQGVTLTFDKKAPAGTGGSRRYIYKWDELTVTQILGYLLGNYRKVQNADRDIIGKFVDLFLKGTTILKSTGQATPTLPGAEDGVFNYLRRRFGKEIENGTPLRVTDVGNGCNPYPEMLIEGVEAAFYKELKIAQESGKADPEQPIKIDLVDKTPAVEKVTRGFYYGETEGLEESDYHKLLTLYHARTGFREAIIERVESNGPDTPWPSMRSDFDFRKIIDVYRDGIFELPEGAYHVASTFFVPCSIDKNPKTFKRAMGKTVRCVKPGGVVYGALMKSDPKKKQHNWPAGNATLPACPVTKKSTEAALRKAGATRYIVIEVEGDPVREEDEGMLLFMAIRDEEKPRVPKRLMRLLRPRRSEKAAVTNT